MNRRAFTRTLGLGLFAAAGGLVPRLRAGDIIPRKVVVVGESGAGKSALAIGFITGNFVEEYDSTLADEYRKQVRLDDRTVLLSVWDTVGQTEYDKSRRESYAGAHLFLVCFDVASRGSFAQVETRWAPEIARHAAGSSLLLVGCKSDLRAAGRPAVTADEAAALVARLGARGYRECSAKTMIGVDQVFHDAVRATLG